MCSAHVSSSCLKTLPLISISSKTASITTSDDTSTFLAPTVNSILEIISSTCSDEYILRSIASVNCSIIVLWPKASPSLSLSTNCTSKRSCADF